MEGETVNGKDTTDLEQFIGIQNKLNGDVIKFMEKYSAEKEARDKQQADTLELLKTLVHRSREEPPAKKSKSSQPEEATSGSSTANVTSEATLGSESSGKEKTTRSAEATSGSGDLDDVLELHETGEKTLLEEELALYNQITGKYKESDLILDEEQTEEVDPNNMREEQVEEILIKEYSDWLSQTEEKVGPPVSQVLSVLCQRLWGKVLLSQEKKKEMQEGVRIPSNCKSLKAPVLNPAIHIRIHENSKRKDDAAKNRQANMARGAIPLLYTLGELDKAKSALEAQAKFLSHEPKNLDEAKQMLKVIKTKNGLAATGVGNVKTSVSKSFQLLNYYCTETTRKRRQDVCESLGSAFKPYGLEAQPPDENLFNEDAMKRMKSELKAIKPKVDLSKNGPSSAKTRRSTGPQGKTTSAYSTYQKNTSGSNSNGYKGNNSNYNSGNNNGGNKKYPQRKRGQKF